MVRLNAAPAARLTSRNNSHRNSETERLVNSTLRLPRDSRSAGLYKLFRNTPNAAAMVKRGKDKMPFRLVEARAYGGHADASLHRAIARGLAARRWDRLK
jgi:hypothetical protein